MKTVSIYEFAGLESNEFIEQCYRKLLGREPDTDGKAFYLNRLRQGESRARVVRNIARSKEARLNGMHVLHVRRYAAQTRLAAIPLLGSFVARSLTPVVVQKSEITPVQLTRRESDSNIRTQISELHSRLDELQAAHHELKQTLGFLSHHLSASIDGTSLSIKEMHKRTDFSLAVLGASMDGIRQEQKRLSNALRSANAAIDT